MADCEHQREHCPGKASRTKNGLATRQRTWCTAAEEAKECEVTGEFDVEEVVDASGPPDDRRRTVEWVAKNAAAVRRRGTDPGCEWPPTWESEPEAHVGSHVLGHSHSPPASALAATTGALHSQGHGPPEPQLGPQPRPSP